MREDFDMDLQRLFAEGREHPGDEVFVERVASRIASHRRARLLWKIGLVIGLFLIVVPLAPLAVALAMVVADGSGLLITAVDALLGSSDGFLIVAGIGAYGCLLVGMDRYVRG
jgi:hypothetical protein